MHHENLRSKHQDSCDTAAQEVLGLDVWDVTCTGRGGHAVKLRKSRGIWIQR